jgi:hypothetical protein
MNRRCKYACVIASLLALIVCVIWLVQRSERGPIQYDNYDRIQPGMTKAEVIQLLGCLPGDHSTRKIHLKAKLLDGSEAYSLASFEHFEEPINEREMTCIWLGDRGAIAVTFDLQADRVCEKFYAEGRHLPSRWWLAIERLLGRDVPWVAPG